MTRRRRRRRTVIIRRVPAWTPTNVPEALTLIAFIVVALVIALVIL